MADASGLGASILIGGPDTVMILACVALATAVIIYIFLIDPDAADSAPHRSHLDQLLERRDTLYDNLRDLKFENRAGKYSEQDYEEMKQALETEAAMVLTEIESVTGGHMRQVRRDAAGRVVAGEPRT